MIRLIAQRIFGEHKKIARTEVNGFTVSTVDTEDAGPETAICDANGAHPVERYDSVALAEKGHDRWVAFCKEAKTGSRITKLGDSEGWVESRKIVLKKA